MGYWSGISGTCADTSNGTADSQRQAMVCKRGRSRNEYNASLHLFIVWHLGKATGQDGGETTGGRGRGGV